MAGNKRAAPAASRANTVAAVFIGLFAFRLVNAYFVQTFFQPDEYFQALEPAWQIAFGPQSGAWITWEWREQLRTSAHPYMFAGAYRAMDTLCNFLNLSGPDRAVALIWAPRFLQALFAAVMDITTWQTAVNIEGTDSPVSRATLMLTVISPWQWHCSTRTFSNSLEATLTAIATSLFPWRWYLRPSTTSKKTSPSGILFAFPVPDGMYLALMAAAIAFYLRPTNIIIWIFISGGLMFCNHSSAKAATLVQAAILVGAAVVVAFSGIDRTFYEEWAFPPLRFLYLNLVQSLAVFYGTNRPDYYFTEGLPLLLTTALPFAAIGIWKSLRLDHIKASGDQIKTQTRFVFAFTTIGMVLTLSMIGHKEMRFIYPLLPMLHILAAKPCADFFRPLPLPRPKVRQVLLVALVAINIYIASYVSMTHQRGVVDVMHYLRHRQESWFDAAARDPKLRSEQSNVSVAFLMPCHSTPWRSHLVYPQIQAWALTCEPPVNMTPEERAIYLDEADVFYENPSTWLQQNMEDINSAAENVPLDTASDLGVSERRDWPTYLVFFEHLEPTLKALPERSSYKECRRFFNTHWIDDSRRKGDVVVWCRRR